MTGSPSIEARPDTPLERRPAIIAIDDEPVVLAAVARDLRRGFGERYRILRAPSGADTLEILAQMRARGDQVALLLADQRMPGMPGTDFLVQARAIVPDAKRVLLTAYADTSAAIAAINEVSLDYYLLKPWDPPEERLFPILEDLLASWEAGAALESGGLRIYGHRFSKESHDLRDFVARNGIPARWSDVERDAAAREFLQVIGVDEARRTSGAAPASVSRPRAASSPTATRGRSRSRPNRAGRSSTSGFHSPRAEERSPMPMCTHLETINVTQLPDAVDGCEDCLATGGLWLHLRICLACGHVGCCDDSPNRHATSHANATGHPLIRSLEPGEDWSWCYVDEVAMRVPAVQGTTRIPPSPLLG